MLIPAFTRTLACVSVKQNQSQLTRDLLEHLIDVSQNRSMQIPILVELETVLEPSLCHLEHGVFDSSEFGLDSGIILRGIAEGAEDFQGFIFAAFEN